MRRVPDGIGAALAIAYMRSIMADTDDNRMGETPRATKRPAHVKPPAGWTNSPVPKPQPIDEDKAEEQPGGRNPVRYGDWELKGLAIDF